MFLSRTCYEPSLSLLGWFVFNTFIKLVLWQRHMSLMHSVYSLPPSFLLLPTFIIFPPPYCCFSYTHDFWCCFVIGIRACWGNTQGHDLRQWLLLTLESSVGNGSAAVGGPPGPLRYPCLIADGPILMQTQFGELLIAKVVLPRGQHFQPLLLVFQLFLSSTPSSPELWGSSENDMFRTEHSSIKYSQSQV